MSMAHNPFYHRGPVRRCSHFCSRRRETEQIDNMVRTSQGVSVVGLRRGGKTSLFYRLLEQGRACGSWSGAAGSCLGFH